MRKHPGPKPQWRYIYNDIAHHPMSKKDALEYLTIAIRAHKKLSHPITLISQSMWREEYLAFDPVTKKGYSIVACHKSVEIPKSL